MTLRTQDRWTGRAAVATALCSLLLATACGGGEQAAQPGETGEPVSTTTSEGSSSPDQGSDEQPLTVGMVVPLTGGAAVYGEAAKQGAEIAVAEVNSDGGIDGRELRLVTADDELVPTTAVNETRRLIQQEEASILIGGVTSDAALALEAEFGNGDRPLWLLAKHDTLTTQGHTAVLANNLPFALDAEFYYEAIDDVRNPASVAGLFENSETGQSHAELASEHFSDRYAGHEFFGLEDSDFSVPLTQMASLAPEALLLTTASDAIIGQMFRQMPQFGIESDVYLSAGTELTDATLDASENVPGDVYSADFYAAAVENAENEEFVADFESEFGKQPSKLALLGYEAVTVSIEAMRDLGCSDCADQVVNAVRGQGFATPRGSLTFDDNGLGLGEEFYMKHIVDGTEQLVN